MDIISIMGKRRFQPEKFEMHVKGWNSEDHPKRFTAIHIHYALEGTLQETKVVRAIQLSKDKYCYVAHSLSAEVTVSYSINGVDGNKYIYVIFSHCNAYIIIRLSLSYIS